MDKENLAYTRTHIHRTKHYSSTKRKESFPLMTMGINPGDIMLNEIS